MFLEFERTFLVAHVETWESKKNLKTEINIWLYVLVSIYNSRSALMEGFRANEDYRWTFEPINIFPESINWGT